MPYTWALGCIGSSKHAAAGSEVEGSVHGHYICRVHCRYFVWFLILPYIIVDGDTSFAGVQSLLHLREAAKQTIRVRLLIPHVCGSPVDPSRSYSYFSPPT